MSNSAAPSILLIGIEPEIEKIVSDILKNTQVSSIPMNIDEIMGENITPPAVVISGPPSSGLSETELAQTLRMQFQDAPIFLCCTSRNHFERKSFIKNGFTDAFLLPMDTTKLRSSLSEALAKATQGAIRVFRPVKIIDIGENEELGFETSIYLPSNNKYIKLSNAGESLEAERVNKIKKAKYSSIQVPAEQMQNFYDYSAKKLKAIGSSSKYGVTEKREKLQSAVRELVSGLFTEQAASFESGQAVLKDCNEIVKSFIMDGSEGEWFQRIQTVLGDRGDNYSHAGNVSTLAALFSMGLGIGKPEDLALAGLLHDIGIAELPAEIQMTPPEKMTKEQFEQYKKHPELSLNLIKSRKIVVNETITKAILQHHERYNGTGYPSGLFGDRICKEAQILAIADEFDYLTSGSTGLKLMTPIEAIQKLREKQVDDPSKVHFKPELLKGLLSLFPENGA